MRTRFFANPGVDLLGIGLVTGYSTGIEIDNQSGSWLYIPTLETFVPPFTIGWSLSFPYAVASVDVLAQDGPAGQISTSEGTGVTVYLSDARVGASAGVPDLSSRGAAASPDYGSAFIDQSVEPATAVIQATTAIESAATVIFPVAGIANRRVRLYEISISYAVDAGTNEPMDGSVKAFPNGDGPSDIFAVGIIDPAHPIERLTFAPPHNLPVGEGLQIDLYASWVNVIVDTTVRYRYV